MLEPNDTMSPDEDAGLDQLFCELFSATAAKAPHRNRDDFSLADRADELDVADVDVRVFVCLSCKEAVPDANDLRAHASAHPHPSQRVFPSVVFFCVSCEQPLAAAHDAASHESNCPSGCVMKVQVDRLGIESSEGSEEDSQECSISVDDEDEASWTDSPVEAECLVIVEEEEDSVNLTTRKRRPREQHKEKERGRRTELRSAMANLLAVVAGHQEVVALYGKHSKTAPVGHWPELTDAADSKARLSKQSILNRATDFAKELTEQFHTLSREKKKLEAKQQRLLRHLSLLKADFNSHANPKLSGQVQNSDGIKKELSPSAVPVGNGEDSGVIIIDD